MMFTKPGNDPAHRNPQIRFPVPVFVIKNNLRTARMSRENGIYSFSGCNLFFHLRLR